MPLRKALKAQIFACLCVYFLLALGILPKQSLLGMALVQGGLAAAISLALRGEPWWLFIHALFTPALVFVSGLRIAPLWFFLAFVVLLLVYWSSFRSRVPLYLSNKVTSSALQQLILERQAGLVVDLGCGTGSLLARCAQASPSTSFVGIETAPLPWLLARWRTRHLANCLIMRGDFWPYPLHMADLVYVFLSPVPMARLWDKARAEMKPGALLVSNSFPIPGVDCAELHVLSDSRETHLFLYQPAESQK